jgi:hypothetical protein
MSDENDNRATEGQSPTEILEPSVAERVQVIGKNDGERDYTFTFVQRPLSFFGKLDFFSVLGKAIDTAMGGDDPLSLAELFEELPDDPEQFQLQNLKDQNTFVRGIAKVVAYAPEILGELYCVALAVPKGKRKVIISVMELPAEEGGLSDEDGMAILDTFVEQNWQVLLDFFKGPAKELATKIGKQMGAGPKSASSKRSKSSRPTTEGQSKK